MEESRLMILEKGMLRGKFESKKEERAGGCRKTHNEEIHNFHPSADIMIIKSLDHFMDVECMGQSRKLYEFFVRKYEGIETIWEAYT
jgi:hypothetical protein